MAGIECVDLRRVFKRKSGPFGETQEIVALHDLSFEVQEGEVVGLLGPNGAGKTTTVNILATLLAPTSGYARVWGYDVVKEAKEVRKKIGCVFGGDGGFYRRLSGLQNLQYFAALNRLGQRDSKRRIAEVLEQVDLTQRQGDLVETYSRGMRQRLHIARAILTRPSVLYLDEPTLGLDPIAAYDFRRNIPQMAKEGSTVLLTTHYMAEADTLCNRILIINEGTIIAQGTPTEIKETFAKVTIAEILALEPPMVPIQEIENLEGVRRVDSSMDGPFRRITVHGKEGQHTMERVLALLNEHQNNVQSSSTRMPTLEEAYYSILR